MAFFTVDVIIRHDGDFQANITSGFFGYMVNGSNAMPHFEATLSNIR